MKPFITGLVALVCSLSLPAVAQVDNSALECEASGPTFFPRGDRWRVESGVTIYYQQAVQGSDSISHPAAAQDAVARAFRSWMFVDCGGGVGPSIDVQDQWTVSGADYPSQDRGDDLDAGTFRNIVYFVEQSADWLGDSQTVALTTNLRYDDTGSVATSDMEFNGVNYQWRARDPDNNNLVGCTEGQGDCYDVESVALHEAGHFLGFNHVNCTDAVMFPHGSGTQTRRELTIHEASGLCALYPPPPSDMGKACLANGDCANALCIEPGGIVGSTFGYCTRSCVVTEDCPTAYICVTQDATGFKFCKPGANLGSGAATGGGCSCNTTAGCDTGCACDPDCYGDSGDGGDTTVDPGTGQSLDLCMPCNAGSQCANGLCVNDGSSSICTLGCADTIPCPAGFTCQSTDTGYGVCWPDDPVGCVADVSRPGLNNLCYVANPTNANDAWYSPCSADLICFAFKPRCEGQRGECVNYCNTNDRPCPQGLTCCFGVRDDGSCIEEPTPDTQHGGCFNVRRQGESCVVAENAVCEAGTECFFFGTSAAAAKCYSNCNFNECVAGSSCVTADDACSNSFTVCCDDVGLPNACNPSAAPDLFDLGVQCAVNEDCDSDFCLRFDGGSACSRECNPVTGNGCPGDEVDVNEDGFADGGFVCRLVLLAGENKGMCWPKAGPITAPDRPGNDPPPPPSGCCSAIGVRPGDSLVNAALWLPFGAWWWRRRRRQRR